MAVNNEDANSKTETTSNAETYPPAPLNPAGLDDHRIVDSGQSDFLQNVGSPKFNTEIALLPERSEYHISELLSYHDRDFIKQAYVAILKRSPAESEFVSQTENLRSGRESKIEIIENLLRSAEGKRVNTHVSGLKSAAQKRLVTIPVLGYLVRVVSAVLRLPILIRNQERFENFSLGQQRRLADYFESIDTYFLANSSEISAAREVSETLPMLFDAVVEVNGQIELIQSQIETINAKLEEHRERIDIAEREHQSITEQQQTMKDKQQAAYALQREFLIQEQAVIVETQRMSLLDLQSQLAELSERQQQILAEFTAHQRRLESLMTRSTVSS